jgi:hypothetical protein
VADLTREDLQRLARLGAQARLQELKQEEVMIRQAFPELFRPGTRPVGPTSRKTDGESAAPVVRRRRGGMSAAARREVSERMKRYWAERRKAKSGKSGK